MTDGICCVVFCLFCCVSCTVALLCAVVLLCLLHGCAGVPTSLNSVATSLDASCGRLLSGSTALLSDFDLASCLVVSGALLHSNICALIDRSSCLLEPSNSLISSSSARDLQHWTWRLHCRFAGTGHQHVLDIRSEVTWHLVDHLHPSLHLCILHNVLIAPFREWSLLCCVAMFWHCISGHRISAGISTFMYRCCETVSDLLYLLAGTVDVLHLWQLQRSLHLVDLVSLHTESG